MERIYPLLDDGYLLTALRSMGISEEDPYLQTKSRRPWPSVFRETLCLAGLFHDIGYPWRTPTVSSLSSLMTVAIRLHRPQSPPCPPTRTALSCSRSRTYSSSITPRPSTWLAEKQDLIKYCLEESHGLPGAIFFLYLNDCLRPYPSESTHPVRRLCVESAAMAILMHDMKDVYWGKVGERVRTPQLEASFQCRPTLHCPRPG